MRFGGTFWLIRTLLSPKIWTTSHTMVASSKSTLYRHTSKKTGGDKLRKDRAEHWEGQAEQRCGDTEPVRDTLQYLGQWRGM